MCPVAPTKPQFSYKTAAEYLGISVRQLQRAVSAHRVRHYKLGGVTGPVSFSQDQLDGYLSDCEVPAKSKS